MDTTTNLKNKTKHFAKSYRLTLCKRMAIIYLHLAERIQELSPLSSFCEQIAPGEREVLMNIITIGMYELNEKIENNNKSIEAQNKIDDKHFSIVDKLHKIFPNWTPSNLEINLKILKIGFKYKEKNELVFQIPIPSDFERYNLDHMIALFHSKLNVSLQWLKHGKEKPFLNEKHIYYPEDILDDSALNQGERLHLILADDECKSLFIIKKSSQFKYLIYNKIWHLDWQHVGNTGSRQIASLYKLLKQIEPIKYDSHFVSSDLFNKLYLGEVHFETLNLRKNYWADDLIDFESVHTRSYGEWFLRAQDIIKAKISTSSDNIL